MSRMTITLIWVTSALLLLSASARAQTDSLAEYFNSRPVWTGTFSITYDVSTGYHKIIEKHDCSATLTWEQSRASDGPHADFIGDCSFPDPVITRTAPSDTFDAVIIFQDRTGHFDDSPVARPASTGFVLDYGMPIHKVRYSLYAQSGGPADDVSDFGSMIFPNGIPFLISGLKLVINSVQPVQDAPIDFFDHSDGPEIEHGASGSVTITGQFQPAGTGTVKGRPSEALNTIPGRLLAGLLGYLGVLLAGLLTDPSSSKFISGAGGVVGLAEALKGMGLNHVAAQGRMAGFAGAALAEAIALAQIYQSSTAADESSLKTTGRLGISFGIDIAQFAAGIVIMESAIGVVATATGIVGTAGAVIAGVGGAAVLTYGVSQAGDFIKDWANKLF